MSAWKKSTVSLVVLVMALQVSAQRRLVIRPQPPNDHIQVPPANLRSTTLYLGMTEDHEAFWNRFEQNKTSLQFRLAQLARTGHNGIRVWGSHRAFLRAEFIETPTTTFPTSRYWTRVGELLDFADDLEIATTLVLFSPSGYGTGPGEAWQQIIGVPGYPLTSPASPSLVTLRGTPMITPGGVPDITGFDLATLWVGRPDEYLPTGAKSDHIRMFSHKLPAGSGVPGTPIFGTATWVPGFVRDYLDRMATVATKKGLQTFELINEPPQIFDSLGYAPASQCWGDVCLRVFDVVGSGTGSNNPDGVGRTFASKGLVDYVYRLGDSAGTYEATVPENLPPNPPPWHFGARSDMLHSGFGPFPAPAGQHKVDLLAHWVWHSSVDPYVRVAPTETAPGLLGKLGSTLRAQWDYYRNDTQGPTGGGANLSQTGFLRDLAQHPYIADNWNLPNWPASLTRVSFKQAIAEEALCRAGNLQMCTDFAQWCVTNADMDATTKDRLGLNAFSIHSGDASKTQFGALFLPDNTCVGGYDWEAFRDNWRRDTATGSDFTHATIAGGSGSDNLSEATSVDMAISPATTSNPAVVVVVFADNYDPRVGHAVQDTALAPLNPEAHQVQCRIGVWNGTSYDWSSSVLDPHATEPWPPTHNPGPLLFDDLRNAVSLQATRDPNYAANLFADASYVSVLSNVLPGPHASCPPLPPPVLVEPFGAYSHVDHAFGARFPYLREDILHRQKMHHPDVILQPRIVFQKSAVVSGSTTYRFFVTWSRPTRKTEQETGHQEPYFPEDDVKQRFFVPFKNSFENGQQTAPLKYEVLVATLDVTPGNTPVATHTRSVLPTWGENQETLIAGNGNMNTPPPARSALYPDGTEPVAPDFTSREGLYETGDGVLVRTPSFGGFGVTTLIQHGDMLALNTDGFTGSSEVGAKQRLSVANRTFASDWKAAAWNETGASAKTVLLTAFMYLTPYSTYQTGNHTPKVTLKLWARVSPPASPAEGFSEIDIDPSRSGAGDLQARVIAVSDVGDGPTSGQRRFRVVWSQTGRIFRRDVLVDKTTAAVTPEAAPPVVAGVSTPDTAAAFLHNGKLKVAANRWGIVFTRGKRLHFEGWN